MRSVAVAVATAVATILQGCSYLLSPTIDPIEVVCVAGVESVPGLRSYGKDSTPQPVFRIDFKTATDLGELAFERDLFLRPTAVTCASGVRLRTFGGVYFGEWKLDVELQEEAREQYRVAVGQMPPDVAKPYSIFLVARSIDYQLKATDPYLPGYDLIATPEPICFHIAGSAMFGLPRGFETGRVATPTGAVEAATR
jgi:hypothetical protein